MATLEQTLMASQAIQALLNVSRDMRSNATEAKDYLARAQQITDGNANGYLTIITKIEGLPGADLAAGLQAMGITPADAATFKDNLKSAAQALLAASKNDLTEISAAADAVLAAVPEVKRLF